MRKKKNFERRWTHVQRYLEEDVAANRGQWTARYASGAPLVVELGCGKGRFITEAAARSPECLFVAWERVKEVLLMTMERADGMGLTNLRCVSADVANIEEAFDEGEVSRLYIQFCDPWSSGKRARRRLTHRDFLEKYHRILAPQGEIFFKTDNEGLFVFTEESFQTCGFEVFARSTDWHNDPDFSGDIITEYEERFAQQGQPIYRLAAKKR